MNFLVIFNKLIQKKKIGKKTLIHFVTFIAHVPFEY